MMSGTMNRGAANPKACRYLVRTVVKKSDSFQNSFFTNLSYRFGSAQDMEDGRGRNFGGSRDVDHCWAHLPVLLFFTR
jgi:hypothetical protein